MRLFLNICYHLNESIVCRPKPHPFSTTIYSLISQQPYIHLLVNHEIGILRYQQQMPFKKLAVSVSDGLMH